MDGSAITATVVAGSERSRWSTAWWSWASDGLDRRQSGERVGVEQEQVATRWRLTVDTAVAGPLRLGPVASASCVGRSTVSGSLYDSDGCRLGADRCRAAERRRFEHHVMRMPAAAWASVVTIRRRAAAVAPPLHHRHVGLGDPGRPHRRGRAPEEAGAARRWRRQAGSRASAPAAHDYFPHNGHLRRHLPPLRRRAATHVGDPTDPDEAERVEWMPRSGCSRGRGPAASSDGLSLTGLLWHAHPRRRAGSSAGPSRPVGTLPALRSSDAWEQSSTTSNEPVPTRCPSSCSRACSEVAKRAADCLVYQDRFVFVGYREGVAKRRGRWRRYRPASSCCRSPFFGGTAGIGSATNDATAWPRPPGAGRGGEPRSHDPVRRIVVARSPTRTARCVQREARAANGRGDAVPGHRAHEEADLKRILQQVAPCPSDPFGRGRALLFKRWTSSR